MPGLRALLVATAFLLLSAGVHAVPDRDVPTGKRGTTDHTVYLPNTDNELHVYTIYGREPGNTILIIGGIHGNEPGGILAADKYVDLALRTGNLIIVPRANLDSILSNDRGHTGDYNRKFASQLKSDNNDDQIISVLKELMQQSDLVLNLHDGSGFYRTEWIDDIHNPFRFGQSIIADCESFDSEGGELQLGDIARRVVERINRDIDDERYHFHFANHNSISPDTKYPEMRKTATYYALTRRGIPAFGVETSKILPSTEMKVEHQVLAINAFMEEFGVTIDVPPSTVEQPQLDYLVFTVNGENQQLVKDGGTLYVSPGDSVKIDHIVGNYERHMYADFEDIGGRNDNSREVKITRQVQVSVRKDSTVCGRVSIIPRDASASLDWSSVEITVASFVIEVNGAAKIVPADSTLDVIQGDTLRIVDYLPTEHVKGVNVNFHGFVGNPNNNRGEDRGYLINTAEDLMPDWSEQGRGLQYSIAAKIGRRELHSMKVRIRRPELQYFVLRIDSDKPMVVPHGELLNLGRSQRLTVLEAISNAPDNESRAFELTTAAGVVHNLNANSFALNDLAAGTGSARLAVLRGQTVLGWIDINLADNTIPRHSSK